ncbi:MAG: hypothetical protein CMH56_02010 [Myxococcales bacterium]|nr:hypothetical protein [Myxococcales bacterium]
MTDSTNTNKNAGIDRTHDASTVPKIAFCLFHFLSLLLCVWIVRGEGTTLIGAWLGQERVSQNVHRGSLLLGVAALYWVRHAVTLFYLLVRKVAWGEVLGLSCFILFFEVGLCLVAMGLWGTAPSTFGLLDGFALGLVLSGSFLNTGSEVQRKWWKRDPNNEGRCYTGGLFAWSMHINYFGDTLLFTGWCLLTGAWWTLSLPLFMALSFVCFHIPGLDAYLAERYGEDFQAYSRTTKKFIPFIY